MPPRQRTIRSLAEMEELAQQLAAKARPDEVWLLQGELGAGKTTFTRALSQALGAKQLAVSPTFTVAAEYEAENDRGIKRIVHLDLYRFDGEAARKDPMIRELVNRNGRGGKLTVVEWAERLGGEKPAGAKVIEFVHGQKPQERIVRWQEEER